MKVVIMSMKIMAHSATVMKTKIVNFEVIFVVVVIVVILLIATIEFENSKPILIMVLI